MRKVFLLLLLLLTACTGSNIYSGPGTNTPNPTITTQSAETLTPLPTMTVTLPPAPTEPAMLTPTAPVGALPTVKAGDGWVRYRNAVAGFEISIPQGALSGGAEPEARIKGEPINGIADGYKPQHMSAEEYRRITRQAYGDRLCTWIYYQQASIVIQSRKAVQEMGQFCFDWNNGGQKAVEKTETVSIDGTDYPAWGFTVYDASNQPYRSWMMVSLPDGGAIAYSSETADAAEYQNYLDAHTHDKLLEIIKTYHAFPVESTPAVPTEKP